MSKHTCTPCPICRGNKSVYQSMDGGQHRHMWEDTDDEITCDYCEGDGRVGECYQCEKNRFAEENEE